MDEAVVLLTDAKGKLIDFPEAVERIDEVINMLTGDAGIEPYRGMPTAPPTPVRPGK